MSQVPIVIMVQSVHSFEVGAVLQTYLQVKKRMVSVVTKGERSQPEFVEAHRRGPAR